MCKEQLLESVNLYQKTTFVLDALDECDPKNRHLLTEALEFLLSKSERPLKVFISSRPDGDIRRHFISYPNIEIQATDNKDDIEKFVIEKIVQHPLWEKKMPADIKQRIIRTLKDKSGVM